MTENQNDAEDITRYFEAILRRRWIAIAVWVSLFAGASLYALIARPIYSAASLLIIEKERGGGGPAAYSDGLMVENTNQDYYETQYRLLRSQTLLKRVFDELELAKTSAFGGLAGLQTLEKSIQIVPVPRSRLVHVRCESGDPVLVARIANGLAQAFVEQNLTNQLFISKEVLLALRIGEGGSKTRPMYEALPPVVNNNLIQNLKSDFARLQAQAGDLSARYTEKHPALRAIRSNMAAVERQIQLETERVVLSLKTELSGQLKGNNVRVVDPAVIPDVPIRPKRGALVLIGLLGGLVVGLGVALLVDALDQSLRNQDDVENKLKLPCLGAIPFRGGALEKVYSDLTNSAASATSESIRNLRTMVDFASFGVKEPGMLVTSTLQEEGKSFIASNIAVAFAQLGERVLLIDGDLRRPRVHHNFAVSSEKGLSSFLASGKSVEDLEGLLQAPGVSNLTVLPCGTRPPNPSELLNTPRVAALLSWASSRFDRVVVDCPPMHPISDTMLWARRVRSVLFVVRYGKTRANLARSAVDKLAGAGVKILGVTLNGVKPGGLAYSYGYAYSEYYEPKPEAAARHD